MLPLVHGGMQQGDKVGGQAGVEQREKESAVGAITAASGLRGTTQRERERENPLGAEGRGPKG